MTMARPSSLQPRLIIAAATAKPKSNSIQIIKNRDASAWRELSAASSVRQQYDWATWQMYHRIVSSRISKNQLKNLSGGTIMLHDDDDEGDEKKENDCPPPSDSAHESESNDEDDLMFVLDL